MSAHLSDDDVMALLNGHVPDQRPELAELVDALVDYRCELTHPAPVANAELAAFLGLAPAATQAFAVPAASRGRAGSQVAGSARRRLKQTAAAGSSLLALVFGFGAFGALPANAQTAFDKMLTTVTPFDRSTDTLPGDEVEQELSTEDGDGTSGGADPTLEITEDNPAESHPDGAVSGPRHESRPADGDRSDGSDSSGPGSGGDADEDHSGSGSDDSGRDEPEDREDHSGSGSGTDEPEDPEDSSGSGSGTDEPDDSVDDSTDDSVDEPQDLADDSVDD